MIIVVGGQKGGTGKSSTATNLAVMSVNAKYKTLLIDADPQSSASDWASVRSETNLPHVLCVQRRGTSLAKDIAAFSKDYDVVIVDCDGRSSEGQVAALTVADVALIVVRPAAVDMWTFDTMQQIHNLIAPVNPELKTLIVFNQVATTANDADFSIASNVVKENYPDFELFPYPIKSRKGFANAFAVGRGIMESEEKGTSVESGVIEIRRLFKHIFGA